MIWQNQTFNWNETRVVWTLKLAEEFLTMGLIEDKCLVYMSRKMVKSNARRPLGSSKS